MNASNSARLQRCENQLRGFLDEALHAVPVEAILQLPASGKWSANDHLAHLAHSHEAFLERIDRILKEKSPALSRYRSEENPAWKRWRGLAFKEMAAELAAGDVQLRAR